MALIFARIALSGARRCACKRAEHYLSGKLTAQCARIIEFSQERGACSESSLRVQLR
jgi:hypothetical protein